MSLPKSKICETAGYVMDIATILDQKNDHNQTHREHFCFHLALMTHYDNAKFDLLFSCSILDGMVKDLLIDSKSQQRDTILHHPSLPWCALLKYYSVSFSRWKMLRNEKINLDLNCDANPSLQM